MMSRNNGTPRSTTVEAVTARWADMVLAEEEEEEAVVPIMTADEADGVDEPTWTIVGRFLTTKLVKIEFMRHVMASVWQPVLGVQISELQPGLFLFVFRHETDMVRVLEEGSWSFDNYTLVCRQVVDGVMPGDVVLDSVDMWVQCHGLPMGYTTDIIQEQVGNFIGKFIRCDNRFVGAPWRSFYRIRVSVPITTPLKRRMKLMKRDKTTCWVLFKYERLHTYCFFCGMMGHAYKFCLKARNSDLPVELYPYGEGLRAGGRVGPRPVGDPWLIPVTGPSRETGSPAAVVGGAGCQAAEEEGLGHEGRPAVVAASKRRREEEERLGGQLGSGRGDTVMSDVSKNLQLAGSGSQAPPSS